MKTFQCKMKNILLRLRIIHLHLSGDNLEVAGGGPGSGGDGAVKRVAVSLRVPANIFLNLNTKIFIL